MTRTLLVFVAMPLAVALSGCGDSGAGGVTTTAPSNTQQRIQQDLKAAGNEIHDLSTQAAAEAKPALTRAKDKSQQVIHDIAVKIADKTATQPATEPAPQ